MKARFLTHWTVSVVAAMAAFIVHLTVRMETVQMGYDLGTERKHERELVEQRRLLLLEGATLRQVDRVEAVARGTLAMDVAPPLRVIAVGSGQVAQRISGRVR
jgi:cell division protein FtsL